MGRTEKTVIQGERRNLFDLPGSAKGLFVTIAEGEERNWFGFIL